jgi:indole-3-glycerol phosphate synthase/phosphoribosylanthranilate isomerase
VAWRAGADAVLLIAAILSSRELSELLAAAEGYGLAALVEIHDDHDLEVIRPARPAVVGINSRNLRTFRVDTLEPLALSSAIDWPCRKVFESGVFWPEDVAAARDGGFSSVLVGEAVVKDPTRVQVLSSAMEGGVIADLPQPGPTPPASDLRSFWGAVASRRQTLGRRPLVKICGITTLEDARRAVELGADLLGLVYAASPRTAPANLARELREAGIAVPLVAVVVEPQSTVAPEAAQPGENAMLLRSAQGDLSAGYLSALQLHGESRPETALQFGWPYYRAVRPGGPAEARELMLHSRSPRTLVDARHPTLAGGSGRQVHPETVSAVVAAIEERGRGALWLAGGLAPENVGAVVARYHPELVDASSRLEAEPGRKDPRRMEQFFVEIEKERQE